MSQFRRTITHWTAGGNRASDLDKKHYHFITEWDGTIVKGTHAPADNIVTSDGDYAAHTLNLNTGSIGVAMAGMRGAVEQPFSAGPSPLTEKQFEAHCLLLAELHREHAIPVTRETCLTHAEVEPTLGVKQRGKWDITRLPFKPDTRGALPVGDYMRERVKSYMAAGGTVDLPAANASMLRVGMRGEEVAGLQRDLARLGYFAGKIDGIYGPRTREAVFAFQADHGVEPVDGIAGPVTQSALLTKAEPRPLRDVTEADLRASDSRTIAEADALRGEAKVTRGAVMASAGLGGAGVLVERAEEAQALIERATSVSGALSGLLAAYWPLLTILAVGGVIWWLMNRQERRGDTVAAIRLDDARTGAHLGR